MIVAMDVAATIAAPTARASHGTPRARTPPPRAREWVGALAAALGGLDALVFSGVMGENAPEVRARACDGLGSLGVRLEPAANAANAPVISTAAGSEAVRFIPTDQELRIARTAFRIAGAGPHAPQGNS